MEKRRAVLIGALELPEELVQLPVDVIAAYHTPAVKAAMNATKAIPIVMARPARRSNWGSWIA